MVITRPWTGLVGARSLGVLLTTGLLALPAAGCGVFPPPVEESRTSHLAHAAGTPMSVETANGSISVVASPAEKDVTVVAKLKARSQQRLDATKVLAERKPDNSLSIYVRWPDNDRESGEGCSFEITMPDVKGITAKSSNGSITLNGTAGAADLHTSNGSVTVKGHDGALKAKTSNGAVTGAGIRGEADLDTSNGSITLTLGAESAGPVELETSNGSVTLNVGRAFAGDLSIRTSNGSVTLPKGDGVKVGEHTKRSAELSFGAGGSSSKIRTSNGSVTVRMAD